MKSLERVNQIISDFLTPIGGYVEVDCSMDFSFCEDDNKLTWSFLTSFQDDTFVKFFEEELEAPFAHPFIYSILHEYGHKMTLPLFSLEEKCYYKDLIFSIEDSSDCDDEKDYKYYNLKIERIASEWATDYLSKHYFEVIDWFVDSLSPALKNFYTEYDNFRKKEI